VTILHAVYSRFDKEVATQNLYKMDTIGDAYIIIGGLNFDDDAPASQVADAARDLLEMGEAMLDILAEYRAEEGHEIHMRIGLHYGEVVGGVVGDSNPRYHIFGDTLVHANLMESSGQLDRIQVRLLLRRALVPRCYYACHARRLTPPPTPGLGPVHGADEDYEAGPRRVRHRERR